VSDLDALGCLGSLRARLALDGVSWVQRGSVEIAVGQNDRILRIPAVICSLPWASLRSGGYDAHMRFFHRHIQAGKIFHVRSPLPIGRADPIGRRGRATVHYSMLLRGRKRCREAVRRPGDAAGCVTGRSPGAPPPPLKPRVNR
jgi:hypothetical protein